MFYKIQCYILEIKDNKKIKIEIVDDKNLEKINDVLKNEYKEKDLLLPRDKFLKNIFYLLINYKTKINLTNINYENLDELNGIEVYMTFYKKRYSFSTDKKYIHGISFYCTHINN